MRNKNNKHLGIEIDPELHYKLHYIAKYEGRSGNGQILYLIRQCIRDFEEKNGKIEVKTESKSNSSRAADVLSYCTAVFFFRQGARFCLPEVWPYAILSTEGNRVLLRSVVLVMSPFFWERRNHKAIL